MCTPSQAQSPETDLAMALPGLHDAPEILDFWMLGNTPRNLEATNMRVSKTCAKSLALPPPPSPWLRSTMGVFWLGRLGLSERTPPSSLPPPPRRPSCARAPSPRPGCCASPPGPPWGSRWERSGGVSAGPSRGSRSPSGGWAGSPGGAPDPGPRSARTSGILKRQPRVGPQSFGQHPPICAEPWADAQRGVCVCVAQPRCADRRR